MYLIGFNGPPRSGKDSISKEIFHRDELTIPMSIRSCSLPMRLAGFACLGLVYSEELYESIKDEPQVIFGLRSLREWMIAFSETFIKPTFGHDFWGSAIALSFDPHAPGLVLVPDVGFQAEWEVFEQRFGRENCLLVQLSREGKDWANDSRRYVIGHNLLAVANCDIQVSADFVLRYAIQNLGWNL